MFKLQMNVEARRLCKRTKRSFTRKLTCKQKFGVYNFLEIFQLQIDQKAGNRSIHHENHVSQLSKSIQSQSNHASSHAMHNQSHVQSGFNHTAERNGHSPVNRVSNHVNSQINNAHHQKNLINKNTAHHQQNQEWRQTDNPTRQEESIYESGPAVVNDGKHSLLQYAMLNFRQSTEK